jgi:hypothetical protein
MEKIKIIVADKIASVEDAPTIICGNGDYVVNFTFDDEWADKNKKTARFIYYQDGLKKFIDVEFEKNTCNVPVLVNTERVTVGVYADGMTTTTGAELRCKKSILCEGDKEEVDLFGQGRQTEYDMFWDGFQRKGRRTYYGDNTFSNVYEEIWTAENCKPKYNININGFLGLGNCGLFEKNANIVNIEVEITTRNGDYPNIYKRLFYGCSKLETVKSVEVKNSNIWGSAKFQETFNGCTSLKEIKFIGEIMEDINFQWSPNLTDKTLARLVLNLKDLNETGYENARTITFADNIKEKLSLLFIDEETLGEESWDSEWYTYSLEDVLLNKAWNY